MRKPALAVAKAVHEMNMRVRGRRLLLIRDLGRLAQRCRIRSGAGAERGP
ncbi:hypothetical protein [Thioclava sp. SK-1]|nr:hypothetical protein [Thioclava sp. SK-1]